MTASTHSSTAPTTHPKSAIRLLTADHDKVKRLFSDYEKLKDNKGSDQEKADIVKKICSELKIHTQIEEEVFYPSIRQVIKDDDLVDEANVEHLGAKELILQLESMQPSDTYYDAKVKVLSEYVHHHIREEQNEMFPKVKEAQADTNELSEQLIQRKKELQEAFHTANAGNE